VTTEIEQAEKKKKNRQPPGGRKEKNLLRPCSFAHCMQVEYVGSACIAKGYSRQKGSVRARKEGEGE